MEYEDQVRAEHFFSKTNITSDFKKKIEIKLSIQGSLRSGRRLMAIIHIHLMIYFLECRQTQLCYAEVSHTEKQLVALLPKTFKVANLIHFIHEIQSSGQRPKMGLRSKLST